MGLDMYLFVEKYESKGEWNSKTYPKGFYPEELDCLAKTNWKRNFLSVHTKYQVGYWRKFYPLHHWFVEYSRQPDCCQEIFIGEENLRDLLKKLRKVKTADELLEVLDPQEKIENGDWEKYYLECLDYTIKLFEKVLKVANETNKYDIIYQASWQGGQNNEKIY